MKSLIFNILPCIDSAEQADACRRQLDIPRHLARELGQSAVAAARSGIFITPSGHEVDWSQAVQHACRAKQSIAPGAALPPAGPASFDETHVQVANETTFAAAQRLIGMGRKPLALNFANGIQPGGGFLNGARAQEEVLCRSSALYLTLLDDPMYEDHRKRPLPDSTDWAILSPEVPVFRRDDGTALDQPWMLSFITCAAPYAPALGQPASGDLLQRRIHRVLAIARAYGYDSLVLGAWGCGAFENDAHRTAADFRDALEGEFRGAFAHVVFAVTDWSPQRRFLGPFRDTMNLLADATPLRRQTTDH